MSDDKDHCMDKASHMIHGSPDWSAVLQQTIEAAQEAGAIIREHWNRPRSIRFKGPIDLVTETDLAVERHLRARLLEILPWAGFVGEETAAQETGFEATTWVVDPLDGTTNFAHKLPFVATSIGLWHQGGVRLGVVYNPVLEELFWAGRGQGAFCNGEPMRVSQAAELRLCMAATGFPYSIRQHVDPIMECLRRTLTNCRGLRRYGAAALDLAYLAWGRLDVFYEAFLHPWDTAAGWLLVEEAGGRVTRLNPVQPFRLEARTILASNGLVHEAMAALLRGAGLEQAASEQA